MSNPFARMPVRIVSILDSSFVPKRCAVHSRRNVITAAADGSDASGISRQCCNSLKDFRMLPGACASISLPIVIDDGVIPFCINACKFVIATFRLASRHALKIAIS